MGNIGRRKLNIPLKRIFDTLQHHQNIALAAQALGCSRGYIYQELRKLNKRHLATLK